MTFHFTDTHGTVWMVLPGLPADYPDAGDRSEDDLIPFAGLTFRSADGELRVLPRTAISRPRSADIQVGPLDAGSRVREGTSSHWEELLQYAFRWPRR